jgi:uncharacterized membrane protein YczE
LRLFISGKKSLGINGLLLYNYLIILGLQKKYKGNGLMRMLSCAIFGLLIHATHPLVLMNYEILVSSRPVTLYVGIVLTEAKFV